MLERNFRAAACIKLGTSVPQGRMSRAPSPLLDHFYMPDGDFRRAMCSHCGDQVRRGKEGAPKSTCYNAPMQHHMKVRHKDLMEWIERAQEKKFSSQDSSWVKLIQRMDCKSTASTLQIADQVRAG